MERDAVHELTAAYALDALSDEEAAEFEAHLRHCGPCREELASFEATAALLAYDSPLAQPPPALRERILTQVREDQLNVVPLASRRAYRLTLAAAAAAACAALGLGAWAATLSSRLDDEQVVAQRAEEALAIAADPASERFSLDGANGSLVVAPSGRAALVLKDLRSLPDGQYYTAWVSQDGTTMRYAGAFRPVEGAGVLELTRPVAGGDLVAVTIEPSADAAAPSSDPILTAEPA